MIKEQVAEILLEHFNNGFVMGEIGVGDDQEATDKALGVILNLFKAEVDKLTVMDGERVSAIWGIVSGRSDAQRMVGAQLQYTKKQLLDLMEMNCETD